MLVIARRVLLFVSAGLSFGAATASCGARSALDIPPPAEIPPECVIDADCAGFDDLCEPVGCRVPLGTLAGDPTSDDTKKLGTCVKLAPKNCDDSDPCTTDVCVPTTGACAYSLATLDTDGDGHRAPLPGTIPGAPDACGDDCDDTSPVAFPGGIETCDGVDNDCNGIVDDNALFTPVGDAARISGDVAPSGPGGLAFSGSAYAATYTGTSGGFHMYLSMLDALGQKTTPGDTLVPLNNGDSSGGPIVWTGDRFGVAWQDRRTSDYEVYFTFLDPNGEKKHFDTQLSFAPGFSVNVSLAWNGTEFIVVWQDDRNGIFNLFGQRVSIDSEVIGSNVALTESTGGFGNESPVVASGLTTVGVAWAIGDAFTHVIQFQTFSPQLNAYSAPLTLTDGFTEAVYPTVVWNQDRYVIAWYDKTASPKGIYATTVDEAGNTLTPPTAISDPGSFRSRYPFMRPLGDRVLVLYSDDRDQNDGYEVYARMVSSDLAPLGPEQRLTNAAKDSVYPIAAFGPDGNVGVLFRDDRENGEHNVYFTQLACAAGN